MRLSRVAAACAALLAAGCTVGPDFKRPTAPGGANWQDRSARSAGKNAYVSEASDPDTSWWSGFRDPVLTQLIGKAIAGNLDLQQAILRVVEAQQGVVSARAQGVPTLNATGQYTREQLGIRGILESSGAYRQLNALADQNSPVAGLLGGSGAGLANAGTGLLNRLTQPVDLFQYGLNASWELDLFGRVRRSVEQAKASQQAQAEATNDALVMLESQVAQAYLQLRAAQALLASQQQNVQTARDSLALTQRRQQQGLATDLDVEQARTQLADYERQIPLYERQAQQAINRLDVLTGQPPGTLDAMLSPKAPLPAPPSVVGVGIPSTLARRRPDIREAEAQLHAATANVGVAVASFYPDISLTGSLGIRAVDASYLTNWASHFYTIGPSISLPLFQGGRLTANLRLARAQAVAAALAYRGTVLNGLREVEDALVAYRTDRAARDKLAETVKSAQTTLYLAQDRYKNGLSDFLQVLDSERSLVAARQQLVQQEATLSEDVVTLYTALGGGWQQNQVRPPAPAVPQAPPVVPAALDSVASRPPS